MGGRATAIGLRDEEPGASGLQQAGLEDQENIGDHHSVQLLQGNKEPKAKEICPSK